MRIVAGDLHLGQQPDTLVRLLHHRHHLVDCDHLGERKKRGSKHGLGIWGE